MRQTCILQRVVELVVVWITIPDRSDHRSNDNGNDDEDDDEAHKEQHPAGPVPGMPSRSAGSGIAIGELLGRAGCKMNLITVAVLGGSAIGAAGFVDIIIGGHGDDSERETGSPEDGRLTESEMETDERRG